MAGESWGWKVKLFSSSIHPRSRFVFFLVVYYLCREKREGKRRKAGRKERARSGVRIHEESRVSGHAAE